MKYIYQYGFIILPIRRKCTEKVHHTFSPSFFGQRLGKNVNAHNIPGDMQVLTAAVFLTEIREAPHGSQSHRVTNHGKEVLPFAVPRFPLFLHALARLGGHRAWLDCVSPRGLRRQLLLLRACGTLYGLRECCCNFYGREFY